MDMEATEVGEGNRERGFPLREAALLKGTGKKRGGLKKR